MSSQDDSSAYQSSGFVGSSDIGSSIGSSDIGVCCVQINFTDPETLEEICGKMDYEVTETAPEGAYSFFYSGLGDIFLIRLDGLWYLSVPPDDPVLFSLDDCPHGSITYGLVDFTFGPCVGCGSSSMGSGGSGPIDSGNGANPWGIVVLTFSWASGNDLDTGVTFLGQTVGYGHDNDSPYMTSDFDGAVIVTGPEVVTINLAAAWEAGAITDTAVIHIAADWYAEAGSGVYVAFSGDINPEGGASSFSISPGPAYLAGGASPATTPVGTLTIFAENGGFTFP
jgi:hypothetical protein